MPSLVYLVYREALSSVFASQVLAPLEAQRHFAPVTLGVHAPVGHLMRGEHKPALSRITERCRRSRIDIGWLPSPPTRLPWLWSDRLLLRQWLTRRFPGDDSLVIRCRGSRMTRLALDAVGDWSHAKIVYDCRGAEVVEAVQMAGLEAIPRDRWTADQRRSIDDVAEEEQRAVVESAGVTCVSNAMVTTLKARYPKVLDSKFFVVPCCPDVPAFAREIPNRDAVRQRLGLTDKFVVTYLGSLAWYQMPEESLRVFRLIRELRPDAHFLAITTDPAKMESLVQKVGIAAADATIVSLPSTEVPGWLVASDLGLILRDTSETNRVASPVKFGEYLAAGIPAVVSNELGDCTSIVRDHGLGGDISLTDSNEQIRTRLQRLTEQSPDEAESTRERCSEYASQFLQWSQVTPRLLDWYETLTPHIR